MTNKQSMALLILNKTKGNITKKQKIANTISYSNFFPRMCILPLKEKAFEELDYNTQRDNNNKYISKPIVVHNRKHTYLIACFIKLESPSCVLFARVHHNKPSTIDT